MPARLNRFTERHATLEEARKDLAWCIVKLDEGHVDAAFMNAAVAVQRMGKVLFVSEWDRVQNALQQLKSHIASRQPAKVSR